MTMNELTIELFQPLRLRIEGNGPFPENPYEIDFTDEEGGLKEKCTRDYIGGAAMAMTFEQVVETVKQFSPKQREILSDLMSKWETEALRHEIAKNAKESLALFRRGELRSQSAQDAIKELREHASEQEC